MSRLIPWPAHLFPENPREKSMIPIKRRQLGKSDCTLSELGLGCASLAGVGTSVSDQDARATLDAALVQGIRFFDTAPFYGYGRSERLVGDALRSHASSIRISTKAGRILQPCADPLSTGDMFPDALPMRPRYDYSYDGVMRSFEDSLQRLGLAKIDILLMHDIGSLTHGDNHHKEIMKSAMQGGYRALEELRTSGQIGAIGLGVNECEVCLEALEHGDWDCFLLAGRYTLLEQHALDSLFPACERSNTSIIIGGPFNSGVLAGGNTYDYELAPSSVMKKVHALERVCQAHNTPLPAAALHFTLTHPVVASVIPGARCPSELKSLMEYYETRVPPALWSDLKAEGLLANDAIAGARE